eukprot:6902073-Prymnesium_polylepis.1
MSPRARSGARTAVAACQGPQARHEGEGPRREDLQHLHVSSPRPPDEHGRLGLSRVVHQDRDEHSHCNARSGGGHRLRLLRRLVRTQPARRPHPAADPSGAAPQEDYQDDRDAHHDDADHGARGRRTACGARGRATHSLAVVEQRDGRVCVA